MKNLLIGLFKGLLATAIALTCAYAQTTVDTKAQSPVPAIAKSDQPAVALKPDIQKTEGSAKTVPVTTAGISWNDLEKTTPLPSILMKSDYSLETDGAALKMNIIVGTQSIGEIALQKFAIERGYVIASPQEKAAFETKLHTDMAQRIAWASKTVDQPLTHVFVKRGESKQQTASTGAEPQKVASAKPAGE